MSSPRRLAGARFHAPAKSLAQRLGSMRLEPQYPETKAYSKTSFSFASRLGDGNLRPW
jgi:hypothetical protein